VHFTHVHVAPGSTEHSYIIHAPHHFQIAQRPIIYVSLPHSDKQMAIKKRDLAVFIGNS
jgi:hypothetical protein